MRVSVNSKTVFLFPTALAVNRFTAGLMRRKLRKKGVSLTRRQTVSFVKSLRAWKKKAPEWTLAEISEKDGKCVTISL